MPEPPLTGKSDSPPKTKPYSIEDLYLDDLNEYLDTLPWNNRTNHNNAFLAFLKAARLGIAPHDALDAVEKRILKSGGLVNPTDLDHQLHRACKYVGAVVAGDIKPVQKSAPPLFSEERLKAVAGRVQIEDPVEFVRRRSVLAPSTITSGRFLNEIYRPDERIIVFTEQKSQGQAVHVVGDSQHGALPRKGEQGVCFLIQPVDGKFRDIPRLNKKSRRAEECVLRWLYLLLESDEADPDQWLRVLVQLPLAIVAIYTSGRRSVHALVRVDASTKKDWDDIKDRIAKVMVPLGADRGALTAVRLSRLPQCLRGEKMQELLYINPEADGTPIMQLPERPDTSTDGGQGHAL